MNVIAWAMENLQVSSSLLRGGRDDIALMILEKTVKELREKLDIPKESV